MAPINLKRPPNSPAQTLTSPQEVRLLARETLRISANLASAPDIPAVSSPSVPLSSQVAVEHRALLKHEASAFGLLDEQFVDSSLRLICCEEVDGRRWNYVVDNDASGRFKKGSLRAISLQTPQSLTDELMACVRSYVVPEGFPDSVAPAYVPYMTWRALKVSRSSFGSITMSVAVAEAFHLFMDQIYGIFNYFFGGAMGVFTTQTLLNSVGVAKSRAAPGAVAINWIVKDGAGRVGKMLCALQGKKFDYDLKQLRISGDIFMELGAGLELATAAMPQLFLPLACAANVAKNVGAVTSTSTRTPIYKAFAKGENIGDITAKGECVSNLADLMGTGLSIMISKRNPSLVKTFAFLSCGYILSSYQEVRSVMLDTLNHARFSVAVDSFLKTGHVPSLREGNMRESIFTFPWLKEGPVVLGPRLKDAFQDTGAYLAIEPLFKKERYMVTYNPYKDKVYALLKEKAKPDDILIAAFHAHVLLHCINSSKDGMSVNPRYEEGSYTNLVPSTTNLGEHIARSYETVSSSYRVFRTKAAEQGWVMSESLLNPGRARLCGH